MEKFARRRSDLRKSLRAKGRRALLVSNRSNLLYLTGFSGSDGSLVISEREAVLVTDFRYVTQVASECPDTRLFVRESHVTMPEAVAKVLDAAKLDEVAFESQSLSFAQYSQLSGKLSKLKLEPTTGVIEELRSIKDRDEIAEIRGAIRHAERAFQALKATLRPEQTEKEIADGLEHQMRLIGAAGSSFPPIVAAGPRSALPHARPSPDQRVGDHEMLLVDWGATARHYKSDLTRLLTLSKISPKLERVYGVVLRAQLAGIAAIRPGASAVEVDSAARKVIEDAGHGKHFGHGLGHGIGLDIHEDPRLSKSSDLLLRPGMVITVEPGIYLPGWGGIRIEDDVLVTRDGHEVLTNLAKDLESTRVP